MAPAEMVATSRLHPLRQTLARCWRADTAYGSANWSADTPSAGQCAITAVLVQELLGGTIHKMMVGEASHYYGRIGGRVVDLTADQFSEVPAYAQQDDEVEADAVWATAEDIGLDQELLAGVGLEGTVALPWQLLVNFEVGKAVSGPADGWAARIVFLRLFPERHRAKKD